MLSEGLMILMVVSTLQGKMFSINFSKAKTKFYLSLYYNGDRTYLFVNKNKNFNFKPDSKTVNFRTQFCLPRKA